MILPIYAYGQPVLRQKTQEIEQTYPNLQQLISDMFETMYHADGVGLAAPQVGLGIRLFVVDTIQLNKEEGIEKGIKRAFINAEILEEAGEVWAYEEGCLSIPSITGDVERQPRIKIKYYDADFQLHEEWLEGMDARVVQHEYDHVDGILFVDRLKPLKRRMIQRKLENIKKGIADTDYKMKFFSPRKK